MSGHEPIGLLVAAVRRRIKQVVITHLSDHSLSPQQFWTVVVIAEHEGLSLGELAERRRMDQPTASRVVSTLARRRLIVNATDPGDRRRSQLRLTREGRSLAGHLVPVARRIRSAIDADLTPAEQEATASGLQKIIASLDRFEVSGGAARAASQSERGAARETAQRIGENDAEE